MLDKTVFTIAISIKILINIFQIDVCKSEEG